MIIMALLFIIQMSVSIGAIAVSHEQQSKLMEAGWSRMTQKMKSDIQDIKDCCGFKNTTSVTPSEADMGHPNCDEVITLEHLVSSCSFSHSVLFLHSNLQLVCFLRRRYFFIIIKTIDKSLS